MTAVERVALFREDIAASPAALSRLLAATPPTPIDAGRRICLTGLGSSRYAADVVAGQLRAAGRSAWAEIASGAARTAPAHDLTVVAISASGGTPEVVEVARRHHGRSRVIAVTNRPESALAEAADVVVPLLAGDEVAGIAGRTFRATLAVLAMLGGVPATALETVSAAVAARLLSSAPWAAGAADVLDRTSAIDVLADASSGGLAEQAALMLREAPRLPAHAFETADWLHVGVYLAWPGHAILRFPGSTADPALVRVATARGVRLVDVPSTDGAPVDQIAAAITASIDAELLAAELWSRTDATDGSPPVRPRGQGALIPENRVG